MTLRLAIAVLMLGSSGALAAKPGVVHPVVRNISTLCKGDKACIQRQWKGMQSAFAYMRAKRPPIWKIEQCNRNASRQRNRVDWLGFNNCVRNPKVKPPRSTGR